ncbi:serine hydrolase domain-containing protein [Mycolicibacterium goodii]|uniref:serine hydrolase domain-containing protein n=1 Tax=Mycolicibacterium goodii TaxID=134601 RepID=UPI001BDBB4CA|nr:serine hydrolase domain-containing protein [Mycolicibacterium goodii]MBU8830821.1 beta-lactamase family protein [Mycolicibacterium goodii]
MIVYYNVYNADTDEKLNDLPIPIEQDFDWTGRPSGTPHRIYTRTIDQAGNISAPGPVTAVSTEAFEPTEGPMPTDLTAAIDEIVGQAMADGAGPGVGVYVTSPHGYYMQAYGISTTGVPLTTDMHFRIGSATKPFTATAVFMAMQDGLISLEDTIDQFDTDEYPLSKVANAHKIRIRHLMMMRSGVFNEQKDLSYLLNLGLLNTTREFSDKSRFALTAKNPSSFEPGTQFQYVNDNWFIISLILKAVRGRHIRDIINEDIIEPLGLTETSWPLTAKMPGPYAVGHGGLLGGPNQITTEIHPSYPHCAGSLVSTLADLHKWTSHMRDGTLLSPEMVELRDSMFCPIPSGNPYAPPEYGYGLAWYDYGDWKGHAGSWVGYECSPMYHKESGSIIVCYENSQSGGTNGVAVQTFSQIFPEIARLIVPGSMPTKTFNACALPSDPFLGKPAPANLGYYGVSGEMIGIGGASGEFTAPLGADVLVSVAWDRTGGPPIATYGGQSMQRIQLTYHNNEPAYGGLALYRLAAAGTGDAQALAISGGGGAWVASRAIAFNPVSSVGSVAVNYGMGTVHTQSVSNQQGITLQVFSASRGASDLGQVIGARNRAYQHGVGPLLSVNTTNQSGDVSALSAKVNRWASIAVRLVIAADVDAKPLPGVVALTGGQPMLAFDVANKVITPAPAIVSIQGGRPGGDQLTPSGGQLAIAGGQPGVSVAAAFEPFIEENVNRTDAPVPDGATGAWVTLGGAGGGGGKGATGGEGTIRYGGNGGGGGAKIHRTWVPRELMGTTYSVTQGLGGSGGGSGWGSNNGQDGGRSQFTSGGMALTANGGKGGLAGYDSNAQTSATPGGTATYSGMQGHPVTGIGGGSGARGGFSGANNPNGSSGGGGGGGNISANGSFLSAGKGGDTTAGPGGAAGTALNGYDGKPGVNTTDGPGSGGGGGKSSGGDGGPGGTAGGGGGGAGAKASVNLSVGGRGGDGYNRIEWSNLPNGGQ